MSITDAIILFRDTLIYIKKIYLLHFTLNKIINKINTKKITNKEDSNLTYLFSQLLDKTYYFVISNLRYL